MEWNDDLKLFIKKIMNAIENDALENEKIRKALRDFENQGYITMDVQLLIVLELNRERRQKHIKPPTPKLKLTLSDLNFLRNLKIDIRNLP